MKAMIDWQPSFSSNLSLPKQIDITVSVSVKR